MARETVQDLAFRVDGFSCSFFFRFYCCLRGVGGYPVMYESLSFRGHSVMLQEEKALNFFFREDVG